MIIRLSLKSEDSLSLDERDENMSPKFYDQISVKAMFNLGSNSKSSSIPNLKSEYEGKLSTKISAEGYLAHLLYSIFGTGKENNLVELFQTKGSLWLSRPSRYNQSTDFEEVLELSVDKIEDPEGLRYKLGCLEKKWYVQPRDTTLSDCDYWVGFFGTSNNLWYGSPHERANPSEFAKQLAYELEKGMRDAKWNFWFFPGPIMAFPQEEFTEEQVDVITDINNLFSRNRELQRGTTPVIQRLRSLAKQYEDLG